MQVVCEIRVQAPKAANSRMSEFGVKYIVTLTGTTKGNVDEDAVRFGKGNGSIQSLHSGEKNDFTIK